MHTSPKVERCLHDTFVRSYSDDCVPLFLRGKRGSSHDQHLATLRCCNTSRNQLWQHILSGGAGSYCFVAIYRYSDPQLSPFSFSQGEIAPLFKKVLQLIKRRRARLPLHMQTVDRKLQTATVRAATRNLRWHLIREGKLTASPTELQLLLHNSDTFNEFKQVSAQLLAKVDQTIEALVCDERKGALVNMRASITECLRQHQHALTVAITQDSHVGEVSDLAQDYLQQQLARRHSSVPRKRMLSGISHWLHNDSDSSIDDQVLPTHKGLRRVLSRFSNWLHNDKENWHTQHIDQASANGTSCGSEQRFYAPEKVMAGIAPAVHARAIFGVVVMQQVQAQVLDAH
jgi:hypothetical protein